jgi:hypothetical protein
MLYQTPSVTKLEYESLRLKSQGTLPPDCTDDCPEANVDLGFACTDFGTFIGIDGEYFVPGGTCPEDQCQVFVNGVQVNCNVNTADCDLATCGSESGALVICSSADAGNTFPIEDCGLADITVECQNGSSDDCALTFAPS